MTAFHPKMEIMTKETLMNVLRPNGPGGPKARNKPAQGNALGNRPERTKP
jgi:hypothetical protein